MRSSMTRNRMITAFAVALLFGGLGEAKGGLMTYSTPSSWSSVVTGVQTAVIPNAYRSINPSLTVNGVTFSQNNALGNGILFNVGPVAGFAPYPALSDQDPTVGLANILIVFSSPVTAFALPYGTQYGGNVTLTLSNGDSTTVSSTANVYGLPDYIGITDTTPLTSVQITTTDPIVTIGNVSFGNLVGGTVAEPSSLVLSGIAVAGVMAYTWRRRKVGRA
jgi:hypothetical protein